MYYLENGETCEYFDFFAESKEEFYKKTYPDVKLVCGAYREVPPLVTILLPTYKRPDLLKQALESAVDQVAFDDYQIIIVDNECVPIDKETETSLLVRNYSDNDKVIYFRNLSSAIYRMDNCVRLAKSEWILFLHDDDVMDPGSLKIQTDIIKRNKDIKYMGITYHSFRNEEYSKIEHKTVAERDINYRLDAYPPSYLKRLPYPGWLGCLIRRDDYINSGGMPSLATGFGDYIMVYKMCYVYGIHICVTNVPLYHYRISSSQVSSSKTNWEKCMIGKYSFLIYVLEKLEAKYISFWIREIGYSILDQCKSVSKDFGQDCKSAIISNCKICYTRESAWLRYKIDQKIAWLYDVYVRRAIRKVIDEGTIKIL